MSLHHWQAAGWAGCSEWFELFFGVKNTNNRNTYMMGLFLMGLVGQSSQGRTPTRSRDKRDKMAILPGNQTEKDRFVPGTGPNLSGEGSRLSQGQFLFVPDTVPPKVFNYVYWFLFLPDLLTCDASGYPGCCFARGQTTPMGTAPSIFRERERGSPHWISSGL